MQLMLTAEGPETAEINDLVTRWRWAMRVGSGNSSNGLMSLGLLRLDGLLLENNGNGVSSAQQEDGGGGQGQEQVGGQGGGVGQGGGRMRMGSTSVGIGTVGIMS